MKPRVWTMGSTWVVLILSLLFLTPARTAGSQDLPPPPLDDGSPSTEVETAGQGEEADTLTATIEVAGSALTVEFGNPPDPDVGNCFPFGCILSNTPFPGTHYQQVYDAAQFPGPGNIDRIQFFNT